MGSRLSVQKQHAARFGLTTDQYLLRVQTEKHCSKCKTWKLHKEFGKDKSRSDGLGTKCSSCRRVKVRKSTKGRASPFKGRRHTEEARNKMSRARRGNQNRVGKKHTKTNREKISRRTREETARGEDHYNWQGGVTSEHQRIRRSAEYADWRMAVFERDSFACQDCGDVTGGNLQAHHLKPFAEYPELRLSITNGLTLCEDCHVTRHST